MNTVPENHGWEDRLKSGLGEASVPDFNAWHQRHSDAVQNLNPVVTTFRRRRRRILLSCFKFAAASLLLVVGLMWFRSGGTLNSEAFAEAIPGVDEVQTMTWTTTYYERETSADGKRTWLRPERRLHAYRHPGQYRETILDRNGNPSGVLITDGRVGRQLSLDLKEKKAVLKMPNGTLSDLRGPFAWVGEALRERLVGKVLRVKSVELLGPKPSGNRQANVFRAMIHQGEDRGYFSNDFWIDTESKQLIAIHVPGTDEFDPETAADRNNPAEEKWTKGTIPGMIEHEFVLDAKLDPALFSLDPPPGFQFEKQAPPTVTEDEMIAYLGAAARFNDNQFPDSPYSAFDSDKFNAASEKKDADRTAVEQALIDIRDKIMMREIYRSPVKQFEEDQTAPNSFHYVGSGVKVDQADRIVGWYKLRNSTKYRAFYGDLTIKDVTAAQLPLSVAK